MSDLKAFWRFVETGGRTAALAAWHHEVGEAMPLVRPLLCSLDPPVRSYPHLKRPGHWMRVVHHKDGSIVAVAEDDCTCRIELSPKDVIPYRLDAHELRRRLAEALSIRPFVDDCDHEATSIRTGDWEAAPGYSFAVFLTMGAEHWLFVRELQRLLLTVPGKFILLTPTRRLWKGEVPELVSGRAVLAALDDMIVVRDGAWRANAAWRSCLASFRELAMPHTLVIAPPPYEFRKDGSSWILRYEGVQKPCGEKKGLWYIRYLLMHQYQDVSVVDMLADLTGDERFRVANNGSEVMDRAGKNACAATLAELDEDLRRAINSGNPVLEKEIRDEKEKLVAEVLKAHGYGGRTRKMSDDVARAYRSVRQCITEIYKILRDDHPALHAHLRAFINTGATMSYKPHKPIEWSL